MNKKFYRNCGNCACFSRDSIDRPDNLTEAELKNDKLGECHRFPPQAVSSSDDGYISVFPTTHESKRCFEHIDIGMG